MYFLMNIIETLRTREEYLYCFWEKTHQPYFGLPDKLYPDHSSGSTVGYWNNAYLDTRVRKPVLEAESLALSPLPK